MSSALKLALIVLAAAVLAIGGRLLYSSSQSAATQAPSDVRIRVAAANLPAGLLLREADLDWQTVSRGSVPKGALVEDGAMPDISGAVLRKPLRARQSVLSTDLIRPDAPGFLAAALKPGTRAVSVPINAVSGNAGLIQPGDYVDILLTQRISSGQSGVGARVASETIVESARIIAVGSTFQRDIDGGKASRAQTVTIEVDPRTAEAVTVASEIGSLSLALRSFAVRERDAAQLSAKDAGARVVAWEGRIPVAVDGPVWGQDISRIYQSSPAVQASSNTETAISARSPGGYAAGQPHVVTIIRGEKIEQQEFRRHVQ